MKKLLMGSTVIALALFLVACASAPPHPFVGNWDINIDTPVGALPATLMVNEDMTGTMASDQMGTASLENIVVDGDNVSFSTAIDAQGQMLTLVFDGVVAGDSLSGQFDSDFGPISVTGTRSEM